MADNRRLKHTNIHVETDYENIVLVDPNKVTDSAGNVYERLVNHEDLVFYANLEAKVLPRTKLAVGSDLDDVVVNTSVASLGEPGIQEINFLNPSGKQFLDTSWSDQQTGKGAREGKGINQTQEYIVGSQPNQKVVRKTINVEDTQGLGITNIKIQNNPAYIPQVTIEMVDVQGRTLFEQGDQSPYSAFFQLPYPIFYLTVKGYYGKAVRYELMLKKFNARFDPSDGNYKITTEFIGRTSAILEDINVQHLFTAPKMYTKQITLDSSSTAQTEQQQQAQASTLDSSTKTTTTNTTKGRQVLNEVYSTYKSKGLLSDDFENLSLSEFVYRIDSLERYINEQFGPQELEVLNSITAYGEAISKYRREIFSNTTGAFYSDWIDASLPIVESIQKGSGYVYYPLKRDVRNSTEKIQQANTKLNQIITKYKEILDSNTTFGNNGSYEIENPETGKKEKVNSQINNNITFQKIQREIDINKIDFEKTFILRKNKTDFTSVELSAFTAELRAEILLSQQVVENGNIISEKQPYYVFGDSVDTAVFPPDTFLSLLDKMERQFNRAQEEIETNLSKLLARKITKPAAEGGLGFNPTIRNTIGVLCANADAFLRLMDETHTQAYQQRTNPIRLTSIISPEKGFGTDTKDSVQKVTVDGRLTEDNIVYPWPQYFEEEIDKNGNTSYVVKYPGDQKSIFKTKGYLYDVWPEIQFVEEYLKGTVQKEIPTNPTGLSNPEVETEYLATSTLEFPNKKQPYEDLTDVPFFYEVIERAILASNYSKIYRPSSNSDEIYSVLGGFEFNNISNAVKNSPSLTKVIKNTPFTYQTYLNYIQTISNDGEGDSWTNYSQGIFVTPYIENLVNNPTKIYDINIFNNSPEVTNGGTNSEKMVEYLSSTKSNELTKYDTLPFVDLTWDKENLSNGTKINSVEDANNTNKVLVFNEEKKVISSFQRNDATYDKTLLTSAYWRGNTGEGSTQDVLNFNNMENGASSVGLNQITREGAKTFYENKNYENLWITESFVNYGNEYGTSGITQTQTTSLLNTPYFANAISESAQALRISTGTGIDLPFTSLGYLLVNSLPLATLREKYKKFDDNDVETELDYVWSVMTKFSAIHKVPYAWILKYGSIWNRYKTYVNTGVDILDNIWNDYDYQTGYDPITSDSTTTFNIKNYTGGTSSITQQYNQTITNVDTTDQSVMNIGFYPKLINDTYYLFTRKNLLTGYTDNDWQELYDDNFYIGKVNQAQITFNKGFDTDNPNRTLYLNNYFQYIDTSNNPDVINTSLKNKKYMLFPSCGFLPFNQTKFECTNANNKLIKEITGNTSVYNGSVRSLWLSPNYGYLNNSLIRKPNYNEYLKQIFTGDSKQNSFSLESDNQYSSIEELFSVFDKDTLDLFENEFLDFCRPEDNVTNLLEGETTTSTFSTYENAPNRNFRKLQTVMSNILGVEGDFTKTSSTDKDSYRLAKLQMDSVVAYMKEFLNYNVILKIGNVTKYQRRIFESFAQKTAAPNNKIKNPIIYGTYVSGTLPGDSELTPLSVSQIAFPDEWVALQEQVGFSTISGLTYTNTGSYITDFFIDNDIEFTVANINDLSQIIKMYATQKYQNPNITETEFNNLINTVLTDQQTFRQTMFDNTFTQLRNKLPNYSESETNGGLSVVDGEQPKLEVYTTLKNLNDKWIAGGNFKTRTLFEDFLFLDRANRDIGDSFTIDILSLRNYLKGKVQSFSLMSLIGYVLSQNNFIFMALPSYINFYGVQQASKNSEPTFNPDIANSAFGTFLNVDYQDSRPKFLCMYVGKPSEHLDMKENKNSRFKSDIFDLRRSSNNPLLENQVNKTNWDKSNKVVGFNLDFGIRNQNIFKSISLDQNQFKNTSETFQVLSDMANQASGDKVAQQTTSLYNIYRTRSYTCSVSSMGNMMIQPTMYFNLRHVPMFYGPYFITNVNHDITINGFETSFEGIRQPIFAFPSIDKLVTSVNKNLLKKYETIYRKKAQKAAAQNATNQTANTSNNNPYQPSNSESCQTATTFTSLAFVDYVGTTISRRDIIDYLNSSSVSGYDKNIRIFALGLANVENNNNSTPNIDCPNYNLYGILTVDATSYQNLLNLANGQVCVQDSAGRTGPIFSFDNKDNAIKMILERYTNMVEIINKLIDLSVNVTGTNEKLANALTYLYYSTFYYTLGWGSNGNEIKSQIDNYITNQEITQQEFDSVKTIMLNAIDNIL